MESVHQLVTDAVHDGARVLCGGTAPDGPGYFYPPTVLLDVPADSAINREEIFGPVAPITTFDDRGAGDRAGQRHRVRAGVLRLHP